MSCKHNSAPIDIDTSLPKSHCEGKCSYQFKYRPSQALLKNKGTYISLGKYSTTSTDKIINNNIRVDNHINPYIFCPSVHTFKNRRYAAELIIVHKGNGRMMTVCIPINGIGSSTSSLSNILSPKNLDSILLKNQVSYSSNELYNLSDYIKVNVPFYSYVAPLFFDNCDKCNYIIYPDPITISAASISIIKKIISNHKIPICGRECPLLYYNKKGATDGTKNDEIYIECQPTDSSGKEIPVPDRKPLPNIDELTDFKLDIPLQLLAGVFSAAVIVTLFAKLLSNK